MGRSVPVGIGKKELWGEAPKSNQGINQSQRFACLPHPTKPTKPLRGLRAPPLPAVSSAPSHTARPHLWSQRDPVRQLSPPSPPCPRSTAKPAPAPLREAPGLPPPPRLLAPHCGSHRASKPALCRHLQCGACRGSPPPRGWPGSLRSR